MTNNVPIFVNNSPNTEGSEEHARIVRSNAARVSAHESTASRRRNARYKHFLTLRKRSSARDVPMANTQNSTSDEDESARESPVLTLSKVIGTGQPVPAEDSPIFSQPYTPTILANYLEHLAVAFPEIDGPKDQNLLTKVWFPMTLHSPAIFQVVMLFSASHYAAHLPNRLQEPTLLYLKQCALAGLRKLTLSPASQKRDETIAVAAKMASYEAIYGSREAHRMHMNAVRKMIQLRGGLAALGLNGFLARLLMFIDTNSAFLLQTHLTLEESSLPRQEAWTFYNPDRFLGTTSNSKPRIVDLQEPLDPRLSPTISTQTSSTAANIPYRTSKPTSEPSDAG